MEERLIIKDVIGSTLAVSSEKAMTVFDKIKSNINSEIVTIVDFSDIKSLTTAFLNVAIGELYRLVDNRDTLNKLVRIDVTTLSAVQFEKVKLVMNNSRSKYSTSLKRRIDEVTLHGDTN